MTRRTEVKQEAEVSETKTKLRLGNQFKAWRKKKSGLLLAKTFDNLALDLSGQRLSDCGQV